MQFITLGTGTYVPKLDVVTSCYLLKANNLNILFDFGRGALNQLLKAGIEYYQIDCIFITHFHADHINDLISLLNISFFEPPGQEKRTKDLVIYGPVGIKENIHDLLKALHYEDKEPKHKIIIKELEDKEIIEIKDIKIKSFIVKHSTNSNCLSYKIENNNKIICYSGDSSECEGLKKVCQDADLAIIEATLPNKIENVGHLNPNQALKLAQECNVKKLVLTHLSAESLGDAKKLGDKVIIAKDMMKFEL
jgi:ribonuclease BN (tRNA processing enzyme)